MSDIEVPGRDEKAELEGSTNVVALVGQVDPAQPYTILRMDDGRLIKLETSQLLTGLTAGELDAVEDDETRGSGTVVIPLLEERLKVAKHTKTTGTVRLHKSTQVYTEALDEVLGVRTFEVERAILNQPVDAVPAVRQEGNVTIYPVVEEQLVLTKQWILREEVRVVQVDSERRDTRVVTLQKEHLTIEREDHKQPLEF